MNGHPEMSIWRHRLGWLTGLGLLVVLLLPQTGWLARDQIQRVFVSAPWITPLAKMEGIKEADYDPEPAGFEKKMKAAGDQHPDDLGMVIASAQPDWTRLKLAIPRFANRPSIYANVLRLMCSKDVRLREIQHKEFAIDTSLQGPPPDTAFEPWKPALSGDVLAEFDRYAEIGENLDPDNAYFPMVRSIGQNVAGRPDLALESLKRASQKPNWESYVGDEALGLTRLTAYASGDESQIVGASAFATTLPHMSAMNTNNRYFLHQAKELDRLGKYAEAIAIRELCMRCTRLIRIRASTRVESPYAADCEIRNFITERLKRELGESDAALLQRRRDREIERIRSNGGDKYADLAAAELREADKTVELYHEAEKHGVFVAPTMRLIQMWLVGLLLVSWAFWMAVFGGAAAIFARIRAIRKISRIPTIIRIGASLGVVLTFCAIIGVARADIPQFNNGYNSACPAVMFAFKWSALPLLLVAVACLWRRSEGRWGMARRIIGSCAATALAVLTFGAAVYSFSRGAQTLAALGFTTSGSVYQCIGWTPPPLMEEMTSYRVAWPYLSLALPMLSLAIFAFASVVNRIPVVSGIVHGFYRQSMPAACVLILAWLATIPFTLRMERAAADDLALSFKSNTPFLSVKSGFEHAVIRNTVRVARADSACH